MAYFWNGYTLDNFLVQGVNVASFGEFTGIFFGVLSAAIIYEGLGTFRDFLYNRFLRARKSALSQKPKSTAKVETVHYTKSNTGANNAIACCSAKSNGNTEQEGDKNKDEIVSVSVSCTPQSSDSETATVTTTEELPDAYTVQRVGFTDLALSTVLHMGNVCLGYTLMLAVMTFNVWILLAVGSGVGIGFFLFDVFRRTEAAKNTNTVHSPKP